MSRHFLVIRLGSLGDVLLTSAALINLRISFPDCRITCLTKRRFAGLVAAMTGVDEVIAIDNDAGFSALFKLLQDLDNGRFTDIVDLHGNFRSWFLRQIVSASQKTVYPKRRFERWQIVRTHQYPSQWPHTIDLYNDTVTQLGGRVFCRRPVLPLHTLRPTTGDFQPSFHSSICIAPGAAHPNKQWPIARFETVARELHKRHGCRIFWVVTRVDQGKAQLASELRGESFVELVDQPIEQLATLFAQCRLVIANDSGLMHLASAVGTPVIGIFGPTHPSLGFAPRGQFDRIVQVDESCRPCSLHGKKPCWREERYCFTRIQPEQVLAAAESILTSRINTMPALFVDRDGTLTVEKHFISDPAQLELIPGAANALAVMKQRGYHLVAVSNQSGVARGYFSEADVRAVNLRLEELLQAEGVALDGIYYCPHHPRGTVPEYARFCYCRKPNPGMAEQAARELGIDLRRSLVIGDKLDDLHLGDIVGARSFLVRTGYGRKSDDRLRESGTAAHRLVFDDLPAAVQHVVDHNL
ncbi:MAG: HAD-IIIA family hydrolase [Candidatus Zixiibacteriota bacterium]